MTTAALGDAQWQALATPRPAPLDDAPRVSIGSVDLAGVDFAGTASISSASGDVAVLELIGAGLLRRRDVHFVERRRFLAAEAAERQGLPRPPDAAPLGVSAPAELVAEISWLRLGGTSVAEIRLVDPTSGGVTSSERVNVPADAGPVGFARRVTGALLSQIERVRDLPAWSDPVSNSAEWLTGAIPTAAFEAFRNGTAAEDLSRWEEARRAYQSASRLAGVEFVEAEVALARTARLRNGGTLGGS